MRHPVQTLGLIALTAAAAALRSPETLLAVTPLLMLLGALLHGRYPGEKHLARWSNRQRPRRHFEAPSVTWARRQAERSRICGGLLIGWSLATRPPPVLRS